MFRQEGEGHCKTSSRQPERWVQRRWRIRLAGAVVMEEAVMDEAVMEEAAMEEAVMEESAMEEAAIAIVAMAVAVAVD